MKGKATLILLDPESGEEVQRIEENNMVTKAVERLLDIPRCTMFSIMNMPTILKNYLPIWNNLLGGVMLLGSNIDEDRNTITVPDGFVPIGTAGAPYSGTDTRRGTFNENESGEIDGGYRLVWDFGTDKANGVIRCIALTSRIFGNIGFDADSEWSANVYCQPTFFSTGSSSLQPLLSANGYFAGNFEPNVYLSMNLDREKLTFIRHTLPDPDALTLTDTVRTSDPSAAAAGAEIELPFIPQMAKRFFDPETMLIYLFSRKISSDGTYDTIYYAGVDPITYEVKLSGSYTDEIYGDIGMAVYRGEIYRHRGSYIEVRTLSGSLLRTIPTTGGTDAYFYVYDGHLCYGYKVNSTPYHARVGCSEKNGLFGIDGIPLYSCDVKPPYTLFTIRTTVSSGVYLAVNAFYAATINNLADPLEKTEMHALKIIYDITN